MTLLITDHYHLWSTMVECLKRTPEGISYPKASVTNRHYPDTNKGLKGRESKPTTTDAKVCFDNRQPSQNASRKESQPTQHKSLTVIPWEAHLAHFYDAIGQSVDTSKVFSTRLRFSGGGGIYMGTHLRARSLKALRLRRSWVRNPEVFHEQPPPSKEL